ncbi:MAG: neutral zinc metallopeptidase [Pirellula sp.]|jgi:predicted metalloprotease
MRWEGREESNNVQDKRGMAMPAGGMALGGGLGTIILVIIVMLLGGDPQQLLKQMGAQEQQTSRAPSSSSRSIDPSKDPNAELKSMVSVIFKDTEDVWNKLFRNEFRAPYEEPTLVLFDQPIRSACGVASTQAGPFYCSGDNGVYLDFGFFKQLHQELGAPGDFAIAYVIAHEVGHHVQNQLGILPKVNKLRSNSSEIESNRLLVRLELQADYLAGVWAHHIQKQKNVLERGDLEEALNAASRIGDDVLQRRYQGRERPDTFTHGTALQRKSALQLGMQTGDAKGLMRFFEMSEEELKEFGK